VYVCVYVYVCICVGVSVSVSPCVYLYLYLYLCVCVCVCVCVSESSERTSITIWGVSAPMPDVLPVPLCYHNQTETRDKYFRHWAFLGVVLELRSRTTPTASARDALYDQVQSGTSITLLGVSAPMADVLPLCSHNQTETRDKYFRHWALYMCDKGEGGEG